MRKQERHQFRSSNSFLRVCFLLVAITLLAHPLAGAAETGGGNQVRQVIPVGRAVGIKLFSDGVLVVGLSELKTEAGDASPAKACGLREGDIITHINQQKVDTIEEVQTVLQNLSGDSMDLRILREGKTMDANVQAVQCRSDGAYRLGAWIRDSMAGIGTVTFYDPATKRFGTLGHGINDVDTAMLMPLSSGSILPATVADVNPGRSGQPGELRGVFQTGQDLGSLYANTSAGVFGRLGDESLIAGLTPMPVARPDQVHTGKAEILSNISGETVESFEIEITKVNQNSGDTRELMLQVTDPALLSATGGIVQGMSGSPILQDGNIVGAVTHVLVNDPTRGYGIFLETMLNAAE